MNESWAIRYRPKDFDEIVLPVDSSLQKKIRDFFHNSFIQGNLLCFGPPGRGKTALIEALIASIVKEERDIYILNRKVEHVENLERWLQYAKGHSKQKIVKIEEMDKLSVQAQILLKDGLMEKHQHNTAFVATTNNIEKIDPALISRFNTKIDFGLSLSAEDIYGRLSYILHAESIVFEEETLREYIEHFPNIGLRDMISDIETASASGVLSRGTLMSMQHRPDEGLFLDLTDSIVIRMFDRLYDKYDKSVLTLQEVAKELDLSPRTLQRHLKDPTRVTPPPIEPNAKGNAKFTLVALVKYLSMR